MPNIVEKMTLNYSPNFDLKKRKKSKIKYLIFHYTGMKSDKSAIKRLTDINSKVSCHYYIDQKGQIIQMVPDLYVCLLYTSPSPRDTLLSRMPSSA